jgi:glycosyltransferase involved in cell wall biosynthesis
VRVLHLIPSYPPTSITGPPAALHRLCQALRGMGVDARVATTDDSGLKRCAVATGRWTEHEGVPVFYGRRWGWRGDIAPSLHRCIAREAPAADLLHVTAVYSWPLLSAARACRRSRTPYLLSPRGSLAPAALAWRAWKKTLFHGLAGKAALRGAAGFHATTQDEAGNIRAVVPGARVGTVPNGVDLPEECELGRLRAGGRDLSVLFLGRLHPHKNPDLLLRAWAGIAQRFPQGRLILAGPDVAGLGRRIRALSAELGCSERVQFPGRVEGEAKAALLARARVLVLPSKSENFGNVVAEALAYGTPVITTRGAPWAEVARRGCGWWVDGEEAALSVALTEALSLSDSVVEAMGARGRQWMADAFSWASVAGRMAKFYEDILRAA